MMLDSAITIFAIGDRIDYDSYRKFCKERRFILKNGFRFKNTSYKNILTGKFPHIKSSRIIVILFFPHIYWNTHIEYEGYKGIYGNRTFYKKFSLFWREVTKILNSRLQRKSLFFINKPVVNVLCRDKKRTMSKLSNSNILTPKMYRIKSLKMLKTVLRRDCDIFIKPRYGSMGKGITYLSLTEWKTNFIFKNGKILNRLSDHGWNFIDITGEDRFLSSIIKKDMLIEKAIESIVLKKWKVDLRVYVFLNKCIYIYPRRNDIDRVITNISQGGCGDLSVLARIPQYVIAKVRKIAERVSRLLNLNFAGIDIMIHKNLKDIYVVDVNAFPGFPKRKTFNISRHMVKMLDEFIKDNKITFKTGGQYGRGHNSDK